MALTQIQTDAIAKARRGDFSLLDAMELEARLKAFEVAGGYLQGGRLRMLAVADEEAAACCICASDGSVTCTADGCDEGSIDCTTCAPADDGFIEHEACAGKGCDAEECVDGWVQCPDCAGNGGVDCTECEGEGRVKCEDCDGSGDVDLDVFDPDEVVDLNGKALWRRDTDAPDPTDDCEFVGRNWCRKILDAYDAELAEAAKAAAEADRGRYGQTTLIPETA